MTFRHLDDATLRAVTRAILDLGLTSDADFAAMTAGVSPAFVATAGVGGNAVARLMTLADRMNRTRVLVSGEVPLIRWLDNAVMLAGGRMPEELVLRQALEMASVDGAASPPPGSGDGVGTTALGAAGPTAPEGATPPATAGGPPSVAAWAADEGARLEVVIEEDDTLAVSFLHDGVRAARSVARLLVHRHFGGQPAFLAGNTPDLGKGTGWLIAPRLLITNHHVVNARLPLEPPATEQDFALQGRAVTVAFDYLAADATTAVTRSVECVAADRTLDFALLRLPDDAPDRPPLRLREAPILHPQDRHLRERVNVLQHPNGDPMRLGFRNNFVVVGEPTRLSYLTDTAGGSSGAPIADDAWFVAGLHRGFETIPGDGIPIWGKTVHQANYGTPVTAILDHLATSAPQLRAEIAAGQT